MLKELNLNRELILRSKKLFEKDPELWQTAVDVLKKKEKLPKAGYERERAIVGLIEKMNEGTK